MTLFVLDSLVLIAGFLGNALWLLNTQVALVCSMLITLSSFMAYQGVVKKKVYEADIRDDRELLDKIEDPYALYEEEEHEEKKTTFAQGVKQNMRNVLSSYKGALSPYRLASYIFLCVCVLFLIRHSTFNAIGFMIGLGVVPLSSLISVWFINHNKELP